MGIALRLAGGNHADAEDLIQDAWVRYLESGGPDDPDKLLAWLWSTMRNLAADGKRRRDSDILLLPI